MNMMILYVRKIVSQTDTTAIEPPSSAEVTSPFPFAFSTVASAIANRTATIAGKYSPKRFMLI